jgi:hypothetical protein
MSGDFDYICDMLRGYVVKVVGIVDLYKCIIMSFGLCLLEIFGDVDVF